MGYWTTFYAHHILHTNIIIIIIICDILKFGLFKLLLFQNKGYIIQDFYNLKNYNIFHFLLIHNMLS